MPRDIIKDFIDHITTECTAIDVEDLFRDYLREFFDFKSVGGPFTHLDPAKVLEEMSPTDFRMGCADMLDGSDDYEIAGENYDKRDVDRAAEEFIGTLEDELTDLEDERDEYTDAREEEDIDEDYLSGLAADIEAKEADIAACKHHTF